MTTHLDYVFSAALFPPKNVVLYITTGCVPRHLTPEETEIVWGDLVQCFVAGDFPDVAEILQTLPYKRDALGSFEVKGPLRKRRAIFDLLARSQEQSSEVRRSVSVKFFRAYDAPHLSVHHRIGRDWVVYNAPAPPLLGRDEPTEVPA